MGGILPEIIIAVATGIFSSWLANHWFQSQYRWERKEESYRELLEALQQMKAANGVQYNAEITNQPISEERIKELRLQWRQGKAMAYRYADLGSVQISSEVEEILGKMRDGIENSQIHHSLFEELDNDGHQVKVALEAVKAVAKADRQRLVTFPTRILERLGLRKSN